MNVGARVYFAACAALCGYALGYLLPIYARLPSLIYDPAARRWALTTVAGPVPMGYYGQIAYGAVSALVCAALALLVTRRMREPSERGYGLWAAWALTALAIVLAWFAWNNWP